VVVLDLDSCTSCGSTISLSLSRSLGWDGRGCLVVVGGRLCFAFAFAFAFRLIVLLVVVVLCCGCCC